MATTQRWTAWSRAFATVAFVGARSRRTRSLTLRFLPHHTHRSGETMSEKFEQFIHAYVAAATAQGQTPSVHDIFEL